MACAYFWDRLGPTWAEPAKRESSARGSLTLRRRGGRRRRRCCRRRPGRATEALGARRRRGSGAGRLRNAAAATAADVPVPSAGFFSSSCAAAGSQPALPTIAAPAAVIASAAGLGGLRLEPLSEAVYACDPTKRDQREPMRIRGKIDLMYAGDNERLKGGWSEGWKEDGRGQYRDTWAHLCQHLLAAGTCAREWSC
jgi:hypothetical protein